MLGQRFFTIAAALAFAGSAAAAGSKKKPVEPPPAPVESAPAPTPPPPPSSPIVEPPPQPPAPPSPPPAPERTDHSVVSRAIGLHFFGAPETPGLGSPTVSGPEVVNVPTAGIRFWLTEAMALDIGAGLFFNGGSGTTQLLAADGTPMGGSQPSPAPSNFAFGLKAGLPLLLADWQHVAFLIEPFVSYYHDSGSLSGANPQSLSSNVIGLGGDLATEIHLGFLSLPQVSFEVHLGARVVGDSESLKTTNGTVGSQNASFLYKLAYDYGFEATYYFK